MHAVVAWSQGSMQSLITITILIVGVVAVHATPSIASIVLAFILLQQRLGGAILSLAQVPVSRTYVRLSWERIPPYLRTSDFGLSSNGGTAGALAVTDLEIGVPGRDLLHSCSLRFPRTGVVLILGGNGTGKTQFLRTLVGLRPATSGTVLWHADLKSRVAYIPQHVPLFNGTMRENIALGRLVSPGELSDALKTVEWDVHELDRPVTGDVRLSGGELKRLATVRALLGKPRAVVIDEVEAGVHDARRLIDVIVRSVPLVIAVTHHPELWPEHVIRYNLANGELRPIQVA